MAFTFLQAVNKVLRRVGNIQGDAGELTTFTDSAKQTDIDVCKDVWNELIHEYYSRGLFSKGTDEGQFALATDTREYPLEATFEIMAADELTNASSNYILRPYPGGWEQMRKDQPDPTDFTGQPMFWVINSTTGDLRIDTDPTSTQSGDIYKYIFTRRISLSNTTDLFPFSDTVVDSAVGAVKELWRRERIQKFDNSLFKVSFNRGIDYLLQTRPKKRYG